MTNYIITNGRIIKNDQISENKSIVVENNKITAIEKSYEAYPSLPVIDAQNNFLCPALFELHIHGCGTFGFEKPDEGILKKTATFLAENGVHTFVPTLQCNEDTIEQLGKELEADRDLQKRIPGFYVEGPFVNPVKKGGIQEKHIKKPDRDYLHKLHELSRGFIRLMTIAPELEGNSVIYQELKKLEIIPCFGHSDAVLKNIPDFTENETINMTHLFNGSSGVSHRDAGLAMLPFINRSVFFELNADLVHCNRESVVMTWLNCNRDRLLLITDAVISAGLKYGEYTYYNKPVVSGENGVRYKGNDVLVGSNCLIRDVIRKLIEVTGASLPEAVACATSNPAKLLGIDDRKGCIEVGMDADLILLDDELNVVRNFTN